MLKELHYTQDQLSKTLSKSQQYLRKQDGSPCPAEFYMSSGTLHAPSQYCEFYFEQVCYAFRVIASGYVDGYLLDSQLLQPEAPLGTVVVG
jgi:hypothetical protein